MSTRRPSAILIAGPTASGKSALAIKLAQRLGGTVVNADSMQVYSDLRTLSARPTTDEEAAAPHLLFGHVDGAMNYSVGRWLTDAAAMLEQLRGEGRVPIFTGGTGMYFKGLLRGLSEIPPVPDEVRAKVRAQAEGLEPGTLHAQLVARDPATAALVRPSDPQRILRALEVFEATGRGLSEFQGARTPGLLDPANCVCLFLAPERAALYARIDARFDAMMGEGALEEVRALAERRLDPALPVMRAHGVPGMVAYLRGQASLAEAIHKGKIDTRHYSKRQFTFIRHQLPEFVWAAPEAAELAVNAMLDF